MSFQVDAREFVSLARRPVVWTLFETLVSHHQANPSRPLGREELLAAVWPDQPMRPDVSANRLQVAVAALRKLGLRDVLVTTAEGYTLEPTLRLVVTPPDHP